MIYIVYKYENAAMYQSITAAKSLASHKEYITFLYELEQ